MNKKMKIVNIIVFTSLLAVLFIGNLVQEDQMFSANENRYLAQKPKLSIESWFDHSFMEKTEEYLNDQFVMRDQWVEGKTLIERLLGKTENNSVYFAKDDYLIEKLNPINWQKVEKNVAIVKQFVDQNPDIQVHMMLIPAASQIYVDKLPMNNEINQLAYIDQVEDMLGDSLRFVNVNELFLEHADEAIYFKTDHHFNIYGAGLAYQAFSGQYKSYEYETVSDSFLGTLASQSGAYYTEKDEIIKLINDENITVTYPDSNLVDNNTYIEDNLLVKDQYTYYLNGNHTLVKIETNQKEKGKLLILRDSYANIFTPYLLDDYSEIYLVDMRYNKSSVSEFMVENEIDEMLIFYSAKNFMSESDILFLK